jgi:hypothetical protein
MRNRQQYRWFGKNEILYQEGISRAARLLESEIL